MYEGLPERIWICDFQNNWGTEFQRNGEFILKMNSGMPWWCSKRQWMRSGRIIGCELKGIETL